MLEKIKFSSNMKGEASNSKGAAGGLLTLYNSKQFKINTIYNGENILFCMVFHIFYNESWFLMNIYAPNNKRERTNYWSNVREMV